MHKKVIRREFYLMELFWECVFNIRRMKVKISEIDGERNGK